MEVPHTDGLITQQHIMNGAARHRLRIAGCDGAAGEVGDLMVARVEVLTQGYARGICNQGATAGIQGASRDGPCGHRRAQVADLPLECRDVALRGTDVALERCDVVLCGAQACFHGCDTVVGCKQLLSLDGIRAGRVECCTVGDGDRVGGNLRGAQ